MDISSRKLKEEIVQKLLDEVDDEGAAAVMADKLRRLTFGEVDDLRHKTYQYYVDQCALAIEWNDNDRYTGNAFYYAFEKIFEAFCKEKNVSKEYIESLTSGELLTPDEYKPWEEFINRNYDETFAKFCEEAYEEVGIDENLDDEILRTAIAVFGEDYDCGPDGAYLSDYFYWHFMDDIWVD